MGIIRLLQVRHSRGTTSITTLTHTRRITTSPISVLLVGATKGVGRPVTEHLRPEYEVIHFIQSLDHAKKVIPQILSGSQQPETGRDTIGSLNFVNKPVAVVFGGAFDTPTVQNLRNYVAEAINRNRSNAENDDETDSKKGVAWLVRGPGAPARLGKAGPGYSLKAVEAIKVALNRLRDHGELERDGLHFW